MKQILFVLVLLPWLGWAQNPVAMEEVELKNRRSMAEVNGSRLDGVYRYYVKGEDTPYTGILYANHPNGKLASWQEYINGVGQGKWINYYDNGVLKEEGYYNQNKVEGPIIKYYPSGKLKAKGNYKDWRVKIGDWNYYNEAGQLQAVKSYGEKGNIEEVQEYYERGEISQSWYESILKKNGF